MPQFSYRARDKNGQLRSGTRFAPTIETLNAELIQEGIFPLEITLFEARESFWDSFQDWMQGDTIHREELSIFSRQMKLLHEAGVPMVTAFKQLASHTRSKKLGVALEGVIAHLEKGQSLANALQQYPKIFSPLIVNLIRIGENTGKLGESFDHIHEYLLFESSNLKQIKSAFRYPVFIMLSIILAVIILNVFVIPSFGRFYVDLTVPLPWQTQVLIATSNFTLHYGIYLLAFLIFLFIMGYRYLQTTEGRLRWDKFVLSIPVFGKLASRLILIRFSQSLGIMLNAGLPVTQALALVKEILQNTYIVKQITQMQESIERGTSFTHAIAKIDLLSQLEVRILAVGVKNGELPPALKYIATFHSEEIVFDLKRMTDMIGPIILAVVSGMVLIIALGVYLPIWNMINLVNH